MFVTVHAFLHQCRDLARTWLAPFQRAVLPLDSSRQRSRMIPGTRNLLCARPNDNRSLFKSVGKVYLQYEAHVS